jgi:hypothetical protein
MERPDKTVSGRWVAIVIMVVIFIAVAAACAWLYNDYVNAPRRP